MKSNYRSISIIAFCLTILCVITVSSQTTNAATTTPTSTKKVVEKKVKESVKVTKNITAATGNVATSTRSLPTTPNPRNLPTTLTIQSSGDSRIYNVRLVSVANNAVTAEGMIGGQTVTFTIMTTATTTVHLATSSNSTMPASLRDIPKNMQVNVTGTLRSFGTSPTIVAKDIWVANRPAERPQVNVVNNINTNSAVNNAANNKVAQTNANKAVQNQKGFFERMVSFFGGDNK